MHTPKKRKMNYRKEKSRFSDQFLAVADEPPPEQHQKSINSKSDAFKETLHKRRHRPNQRP
jgi:hypothetical protein